MRDVQRYLNNNPFHNYIIINYNNYIIINRSFHEIYKTNTLIAQLIYHSIELNHNMDTKPFGYSLYSNVKDGKPYLFERIS